MIENGVVPANLSTLFQSASNSDLDKAPTPFSLRLTREERAQLDARAGAQPAREKDAGPQIGEAVSECNISP